MGCFDPYSDDPRLGVQKIHLCKYSGYLTVAGTAGQVRASPALILQIIVDYIRSGVTSTVPVGTN